MLGWLLPAADLQTRPPPKAAAELGLAAPVPERPQVAPPRRGGLGSERRLTATFQGTKQEPRSLSGPGLGHHTAAVLLSCVQGRGPKPAQAQGDGPVTPPLRGEAELLSPSILSSLRLATSSRRPLLSARPPTPLSARSLWPHTHLAIIPPARCCWLVCLDSLTSFGARTKSHCFMAASPESPPRHALDSGYFCFSVSSLSPFS